MPQAKRTKKAAAEPNTVEGTATETASVAVVGPDTPASIWQAVDRADEELVMAEIAGQMVETMGYEFPVGSGDDRKVVRGLSIAGVNEACRVYAREKLGRIELPTPPVFRRTVDGEGEDVYECDVRATDPANGNEAWGTAEARIFPTTREGRAYHDPHARRKALSKAQRNAKKQLLPIDLVTTMLQMLTIGQVRKVETFRQIEAGQAQDKQADRQKRTRAKPAAKGADTVTANASQQRMLMGRAKAAGLDHPDKDPRLPAIWGWCGGSIHLDRIHKSKVDNVLEAYGDVDGVIAAIHDRARDGDEGAKWIVEHVLEPPKPPEGQQQMATS